MIYPVSRRPPHEGKQHTLIDVLILPVSGVLKLWYLVLSALGLAPEQAWLISLVGLIVTVRCIILPLVWKTFLAGRIAANLRPQLRRVAARKGADAEARARSQASRQAIYSEQGFNPMAGCLPALIQIPVLIGLYRLMLRLAHPADGLSGTPHRIGALSANDVSTFLQVRFRGIPIPAYLSMRPEQFAALNTTRPEVMELVAPLLLAAAAFTTLNMVLALVRTWITMDRTAAISRGIFFILLAMAFIGPMGLMQAALLGPIPVAIVLYWFCNNLWTLAQQAVLALVLHYRHPLTPEFKALQRRDVQERRDARFRKRRRRLLMLRLATALTVEDQERIRADLARLDSGQPRVHAVRFEDRERRRANSHRPRHAIPEVADDAGVRFREGLAPRDVDTPLRQRLEAPALDLPK